MPTNRLKHVEAVLEADNPNSVDPVTFIPNRTSSWQLQEGQWCFTHNAWCGTNPPTIDRDTREVHCSRHTQLPCAKCEVFMRGVTKHYAYESGVVHVCSKCYQALTKHQAKAKANPLTATRLIPSTLGINDET